MAGFSKVITKWRATYHFVLGALRPLADSCACTLSDTGRLYSAIAVVVEGSRQSRCRGTYRHLVSACDRTCVFMCMV